MIKIKCPTITENAIKRDLELPDGYIATITAPEWLGFGKNSNTDAEEEYFKLKNKSLGQQSKAIKLVKYKKERIKQ